MLTHISNLLFVLTLIFFSEMIFRFFYVLHAILYIHFNRLIWYVWPIKFIWIKIYINNITSESHSSCNIFKKSKKNFEQDQFCGDVVIVFCFLAQFNFNTIGISVYSNTNISDQQLSSNFCFETVSKILLASVEPIRIHGYRIFCCPFVMTWALFFHRTNPELGFQIISNWCCDVNLSSFL